LIHALGNSSALVLQGLSLRARRRRNRARGQAYSALAFGIAGFSAWLGGHLSFSKGVGVNQTAFDEAPGEWTPVLHEAQLTDGRLIGTQIGATPLLLLRRGNTIHALDDRCAHRGCALHEGRLDGETIICPCHGSAFRLDGSLVRGPATSPQPSFAARLRDGVVEVRSADA
jgi:nitrite reductase/ring-hydroxylating ferredoxin subunit